MSRKHVEEVTAHQAFSRMFPGAVVKSQEGNTGKLNIFLVSDIIMRSTNTDTTKYEDTVVLEPLPFDKVASTPKRTAVLKTLVRVRILMYKTECLDGQDRKNEEDLSAVFSVGVSLRELWFRPD